MNVWQLLKQRDLTARALERRQIWIEQNKGIYLGRSRVAIVTGNNSLTWMFLIKIHRIKREDELWSLRGGIEERMLFVVEQKN